MSNEQSPTHQTTPVEELSITDLFRELENCEELDRERREVIHQLLLHREQNQLTQDTLAAYLNIKVAAYKELEKGSLRYPVIFYIAIAKQLRH